MNFFILGLPRSRTAWLANFMTYGNSFCYHEGIDGCYNMADYKRKLGNDKGDSSTASMMLDLDKHFPDTKKVIIKSDVQRAMDFSIELVGDAQELWFKDSDARLDQLDGLRIHFDDINNNLATIWEYLNESDYDAARGDMLAGMNIQVCDPYRYDDEALKAMVREFL